MPRLATKEEASHAGEILGRAFASDPVIGAFMTAGRRRTARLAKFFGMECGLTLSGYGEVWLDDDGLGAAIWRRPGGFPEPASVQLRMLPRYLVHFPREFFRVSRAMGAIVKEHPKEPPHWYLLAVGIVPEAQGQGRGAALLAPVLQRCDEERIPAYLEASTDDNARLYERLGFESREEVEALPGVRVRPMWRPPAES